MVSDVHLGLKKDIDFEIEVPSTANILNFIYFLKSWFGKVFFFFFNIYINIYIEAPSKL